MDQRHRKQDPPEVLAPEDLSPARHTPGEARPSKRDEAEAKLRQWLQDWQLRRAAKRPRDKSWTAAAQGVSEHFRREAALG